MSANLYARMIAATRNLDYGEVAYLLDNLYQSAIARRAHHPRGDSLSRAATAILNLVRTEMEIQDDLAAFHAPSECYCVAMSALPDYGEVLEQFGFTMADYNHEVAKRITEKQAQELMVLC